MERAAGGPAFHFLCARAAAVPWSLAQNRGAAEAEASIAHGPLARAEVAGACKVLKRPAAAPAKEVPDAWSNPAMDDGLFVVYLGVPPPVPAGLVAAVGGDEDAQLIAAVSALWSRMALWKHNSTLYHRCYYRLRKDEEPALFACFNAVCILHREAAGTLWRGGDSCFAFVVVIEGSVRMDMAGAEGKVLQAGRMEFFVGSSLTLSSAGQPAARAAVAYVESLKSRLSCAPRLRKVVLALSKAAVCHAELVENETEQAEAMSISQKRCRRVAKCAEQAAAPPPADIGPPEAKAQTSGESWEESTVCHKPCLGSRPPTTKVARQESMGMRWPQHRGVLLHRFFHPDEGAPVDQWRELLRTWPASFLQYVWTYTEAAFDLLAGEAPNAVRMDAQRIFPLVEFQRLRAQGYPIQLLKDSIQFGILQVFGGWFADLDLVMVRDGMWENPAEWADEHAGRMLAKPGAAGRLVCHGDPEFSAGGDVCALFFSEFERGSSDAYAKRDEKVIFSGDRRLAVNLGLVWAPAGSPVCDLAVQRLRQITRKQQQAFSRPPRTDNVRLHPSWLVNQLSVQAMLRGRTDIRIAQPKFAFPLARFLRRLPTNDCVLHGTRMNHLGTATAASFAVCLWSSVWAPALAAEVLQGLQEVKAAATDAARPHGESCGKVVQAERPARHGEGSGSSDSSAPVARTVGEGSASGEDVLLIQVVRILHQQGFDLFSQAGADLILAHQCVAAAIGFASACNVGTLANRGFSATALAYGFACAGAKAHWPQDTLANGLASLKHSFAWWGASLDIPDALRSPVRFHCERASLVGGLGS